MTLHEFIQTHNYDEVTVYDKDYDIETYFYKDVSDDKWDNAITELSKLLTVSDSDGSAVTVNLSELIESKIDNLRDLFLICKIDEIMDSIESALAGNVSEGWITDFVSALK